MKTYTTQKEYKISYICWKCERMTEHAFEKCLIGYGDDLNLTYLSLCQECDIYEEFEYLEELEEKQGLERYYILDLERTIRFNEPYYWTKDRYCGYTTNLEEAGQYSVIMADENIENDRDGKTVKVKVETVNKILKI